MVSPIANRLAQSTWLANRISPRLFTNITELSTGQYRELGVLLWRGWGIDAAMAQCFGNEQDTSSKGRQMPVVCVHTPSFLFTTLIRVLHAALGFS